MSSTNTSQIQRVRRRSVPVSPGIWMLALVIVQSFSLRSDASDVQAQEILKKMSALYEASSYQGAAVVTEKGVTDDKKPFVVKGTEEVVYKTPNKYLIKSAGDAVGGVQIRAFDGKDNISYNSALKQYIRTPFKGAVLGKSNLPLLSLFGIAVDIQNGKLLGSAVVGGRAAFLVQTTLGVPPLKSDATAEDRKALEEFKKTLQPFELAIDKKDYRLLRVVQTSTDPKMTKTLEFTQQAFSVNLPDSLFSFADPAAAAGTAPGTRPTGKPVDVLSLPSIAAQRPKTDSNIVGKGGGNPLPPPHASPSALPTATHP